MATFWGARIPMTWKLPFMQPTFSMVLFVLFVSQFYCFSCCCTCGYLCCYVRFVLRHCYSSRLALPLTKKHITHTTRTGWGAQERVGVWLAKNLYSDMNMHNQQYYIKIHEVSSSDWCSFNIASQLWLAPVWVDCGFLISACCLCQWNMQKPFIHSYAPQHKQQQQ